jgi:glycosyltransferase AglD
MYRKVSAIVIPTLIAVGIIAYMLLSVWDDLLVAIKHMVPSYLIAASLICVCAWLLRGWRYRIILNRLNYDVRIAVATACIFVSQTVNLIVPARLGDFVRVFILHHEYNTTYSEGVSSIVVERVFDIITIALLGAVSLHFVLNVPPWFFTVIMIPLVAGVLFFGFLLMFKKVTTQNRYIQIFLTMLHDIRRASLTVRSIISLMISSFFIWILDVLVCFAVAMMFGQQIPFAVIVLAIVIGNLVKAVPITPGGVGTYELSLALTFELAGVSPAVATLIAVVDHLIKNLVTLAGGILSIFLFGDWVVPSIRKALSMRLGGGGNT